VTDIEKPSKSQRKRDMLALQKIGEILVELPESQLAAIPLDPLLAEAIHHARTLTSHEAKRRQLQYIGRLMRKIDPTPIEEAVAKIQLKSNEGKALFHQIERWRDKLIAEGDTQLQLFIQQYPQVDHQRLRTLVRSAQQQKAGALKELFRYLREVVG
jgi:ribosome-associated protein